MLEQQRVEYLQAMGIQLWMPRHALDHAADSSWLADFQSDKTQTESAGSGSQVQAGHAADLLAGMGLGETTAQLKTQPNSEKINQQDDKVAVAKPSSSKNKSSDQVIDSSSEVDSEIVLPIADLTVPKFELHFALWPCGILWVACQPFDQADHAFQTAVSYSLLTNVIPQANYSQFKWPYIEGSSEDQSMAVALRALTAQWEFMSGQGARGWVAIDGSSYEWLSKVAVKALFSVDERDELFSPVGKKQLWQALQTLPKNSNS